MCAEQACQTAQELCEMLLIVQVSAGLDAQQKDMLTFFTIGETSDQIGKICHKRYNMIVVFVMPSMPKFGT